eukprot:augustus_masked-scaffold_1-processed-gene-5.56-mRNA-1 protein AED:1.00 eAED:1.00 QI:0/-1/0/0/-1/1/1/0/223
MEVDKENITVVSQFVVNQLTEHFTRAKADPSSPRFGLLFNSSSDNQIITSSIEVLTEVRTDVKFRLDQAREAYEGLTVDGVYYICMNDFECSDTSVQEFRQMLLDEFNVETRTSLLIQFANENFQMCDSISKKRVRIVQDDHLSIVLGAKVREEIKHNRLDPFKAPMKKLELARNALEQYKSQLTFAGSKIPSIDALMTSDSSAETDISRMKKYFNLIANSSI